MKFIKRKSIIAKSGLIGNISDTLIINDKQQNAPSINLVQNMVGEIVQSYVNNDGAYVTKFSDGTMYQSYYMQLGEVPLTKQYGSIYIFETMIDWTFPEPFISIPNVVTQVFYQGGIGGVCQSSLHTQTKSGSYYLWYPQSYTFTSGRCSITFKAEGKWK